MPYALTIRGPVLYVSWKGLRPGDLDTIRGEITKLRQRRSVPVAYLSRIPGSGGVFGADERRVLGEFLASLVEDCASIHHIIEGEGFLAGARRAIVTGMALATSRPRIFHTHATVAEAAALVRTLYDVDLTDLADELSFPASTVRVKSVPPASGATSAFREAMRIAGNPKRRRD
jgi:hypothetical protein